MDTDIDVSDCNMRTARRIRNLEFECESMRQTIKGIWAALGIANYEDADGKTIVELVANRCDMGQHWRAAASFLYRLAETRYAEIVSSGDCSAEEIAAAQACGRFHADTGGFGYVLRLTGHRADSIGELQARLARWESDPAYQYAGVGPIKREAIERRDALLNQRFDELNTLEADNARLAARVAELEGR